MADILVPRQTLETWRTWVGLANNTLHSADIGRDDARRLGWMMDELKFLLAHPVPPASVALLLMASDPLLEGTDEE